MGEESKHTTARKPGPLYIIHFLGRGKDSRSVYHISETGEIKPKKRGGGRGIRAKKWFSDWLGLQG